MEATIARLDLHGGKKRRLDLNNIIRPTCERLLAHYIAVIVVRSVLPPTKTVFTVTKIP